MSENAELKTAIENEANLEKLKVSTAVSVMKVQRVSPEHRKEHYLYTSVILPPVFTYCWNVLVLTKILHMKNNHTFFILKIWIHNILQVFESEIFTYCVCVCMSEKSWPIFIVKKWTRRTVQRYYCKSCAIVKVISICGLKQIQL